jgi:hypothetical protein
MRIVELKGVQGIKQSPVGVAAKQIGDRVNSNAWEKFKFELAELGFERLGSGVFGTVFERPGYPWVFKVFNNDPGYLAYLNYVINHQNLSAVPKIKGRPVRINKNTYAIRMEPLYKLRSELAWELNNTPTDGLKSSAYKEFVDMIAQQWPDVAKVLADLPGITGKSRLYLDLHDENVMQRADGTPVITDPLVT